MGVQFRATFTLAAIAMAATLAFSIFTIAAAVPPPAKSTGPKSPEVQTQSGAVLGAESADDTVVAFKGIPYAAPPVGDLRWKEPQPPAKWQGVKQATNFGPRCMQAFLFHDMVFRDAGPSEDCLYLNVWVPKLAPAPKATATQKLPVMVWIYGGGFQGGSTSEPRQDGERLAHQGVIVVSMNYRLGIFGFFSHPHLTAESPNHASGNYGLLDQVAALRWVRDNIASFGGDPANVTIFGESAGSFSVSALMASPLSRGLVHKAIGESGAYFSTTLSAIPLAESEQRGALFTEQLHLKSIGELRQLSADRLLAAATQASEDEHFRPIVDGYFLPKPVPEIYAQGQQLHIPLLAGWNRDEGSAKQFFGDKPPTKETYAAELRRQFADSAPAAQKLFPADTPEQLTASASLISTAKWIALGTWEWIESHTRTGASPVYRYRFDQAPPRASDDFDADPKIPNWTPSQKITPNKLAYHSSEIEFVFNTQKSKKGMPWTKEDFRLSELMGTYWTNFAKTGNPNAPGVPPWPPYSATDGFQVMHLESKPQATPDQHRAQYEFLSHTPPQKSPE